MIIYEDNKAAKQIASKQLSKSSMYSRHYDIALLHVNDFVKRVEVKIEYVKTDANVADIYTKLVQNKTFYTLRELLNLVNVARRQGTRYKELM